MARPKAEQMTVERARTCSCHRQTELTARLFPRTECGLVRYLRSQGDKVGPECTRQSPVFSSRLSCDLLSCYRATVQPSDGRQHRG